MSSSDNIKILARDYALLLVERDLLLKMYCKETKKKKNRVKVKVGADALYIYTHGKVNKPYGE